MDALFNRCIGLLVCCFVFWSVCRSVIHFASLPLTLKLLLYPTRTGFQALTCSMMSNYTNDFEEDLTGCLL